MTAQATTLILGGLRQMEMNGAADYVERLALDRRDLLEAAQHAIDRSGVVTRGRTLERGIFVEGEAFGALEQLVASLEEAAPAGRPQLTVHQGGGPPTRPTKRRVSTPEGDPA